MPEWLKKIVEKLTGKKAEDVTPEELKYIQDNLPVEDKKPDVEHANGNDSEQILKRLDALSASQALATQKQEAAEKALQEQIKKERSDKIAAEIKSAIEKGKIKAANEEDKQRWQKRFETDFDDAKLLLSQMPDTISGNDKGNSTNTQTSTTGQSRSELMDAARAAFKNN